MRQNWGNVTLKLLFVIIFVCYVASTNLFTHTHIIDNVMIAHSHPFKSGNNGLPFHEHTDAQLHLINILSSFFSSDSILARAILNAFIATGIILNIGITIIKIHSFVKIIFRLRPPPFFIA